MNEIPIRNEPGFENLSKNSEKSIDFNNYVTFNKYKLTILDVIQNKFLNLIVLKVLFKKILKINIKDHINNLLSYKEVYDCNKTYESPIYFLKNFKTPYDILLADFLKLDSKESLKDFN